MYYHCRSLKYVEYGKVFPPPIEKIEEGDEYMLKCYKWLGHYCGYCPQVWLSRSHHSITGFKRNAMLKKRDYVLQKRSTAKEIKDRVLFGFDIIQGFPVSYDPWEFLMNSLFGLDLKDSVKDANEKINQHFKTFEGYYTEDKMTPDGEVKDWIDCGRDVETYLKRFLFVEKDQVVVPSLNLKVAKKIICRDERQKKELRKMGFIEDRIEIKNIKPRQW